MIKAYLSNAIFLLSISNLYNLYIWPHFCLIIKSIWNLKNDFIFLGTKTNFKVCIKKKVDFITQKLLESWKFLI